MSGAGKGVDDWHSFVSLKPMSKSLNHVGSVVIKTDRQESNVVLLKKILICHSSNKISHNPLVSIFLHV